WAFFIFVTVHSLTLFPKFKNLKSYVHISEKFTYNKEDTKESPQSTSLLLLVLYGKYTISSIASDRLGCLLRHQVFGIPLHRYRSIFTVRGINMNYTYIVQCSDGTFYTGWTNDLSQRLNAHNSRKGAKYTRNRTPVVLVYYEAFLTRQEAMKREYSIKQLSRKEKLALINF
ncbi:GIY-YIG catalytic domain protein, partial [Blautia hydrogenotrophica DSM 10507]